MNERNTSRAARVERERIDRQSMRFVKLLWLATLAMAITIAVLAHSVHGRRAGRDAEIPVGSQEGGRGRAAQDHGGR